MKILFFGDSITDSTRLRGSDDAGRVRESYSVVPRAYGSGYVFLAATELFYESPMTYTVLNRGIGGDRLPQLYARLQLDVWSEAPDVLSILVGVNDVNRDGQNPNFTDLERWGRVYRMMIRDTLERLPDVRIIICEPFDMRDGTRESYFEGNKNHVYAYAKEAERIAEEFGLPFVSLQKKLDCAADKYGVEAVCFDRLHPAPVGSKIIATEWLRTFRSEILGK